MTPARRAADLLWLIVIAALSAGVRWWHLGSASLWWDELIHIGTAQLPSPAHVFEHARLGMPAGSGNAGAVPLDYVLLHLYLAWVPFPDEPAALERYFRLPSFLYASLTPPLLFLFARRHFGRTPALLAGVLFALCVPHVLYAAEARFYSLLTLMTVLDLLAFGWLVTTRRTSAWVVFTLLAICYFLTGLFGLLVLAAQYAALALSVLGRWRRRALDPADWRRREAWILFASALVVAAAVVAYFIGLDPNPRRSPRSPVLDPLRVTWETLPLFFGESRLLAGAALAGGAWLSFGWRRRRAPRTLCVPLGVVLLGVMPAIMLIERWQNYYFHPRHALFAMPVFHLGAALALAGAARWMRRPLGAWGRSPGARTATAAVLLALVVALAGPMVGRFLAQPNPFFLRTKILRDFKGLMAHYERWIATMPRHEHLLVLAERYDGGYTGNPVLAKYLRWYGLDDRVVLRGTGNPQSTLRRLAAQCETRCLGLPGGVLQNRLGQHEWAVNLPLAARRLMGVGPPIGQWPGWVGGVSVVAYEPLRQGPWAKEVRVARFPGIVSWERRRGP